jgi:hypothetical protein
MPTIADYVVITDGKFTVGTADNIADHWTKRFTLESGASLASRSILQFVLIRKGTGDFNVGMKINDSDQLDYTFAGVKQTIVNTIHEVISPNLLKLGTDANEIAFGIGGGTGSIEIGDIVLHYQRTI